MLKLSESKFGVLLFMSPFDGKRGIMKPFANKVLGLRNCCGPGFSCKFKSVFFSVGPGCTRLLELRLNLACFYKEDKFLLRYVDS